MRSIAIAAFLACVGSAHAGERADLAKVRVDPKSFVGRSIEMTGASCVANPRGGFACRLGRPGSEIRVTAFGLGPDTALVIAEKLIGPCKGLDKLGRQACRFTITITPNSVVSEKDGAEFGEPWTSVYSGMIEMR